VSGLIQYSARIIRFMECRRGADRTPEKADEIVFEGGERRRQRIRIGERMAMGGITVVDTGVITLVMP
jgi:hypothetical protein